MSDPAYTIEPRDKRVEVTGALIAAAVRPGNTVTFVVEVDLTAIDRDRSVTVTAHVVRAVALALRDYPYANRRVRRVLFPWPGPRLQTFRRADVAVAPGFGVPGSDADAVVTIVREADRLTPAEIDAAIAQAGPVEARARAFADTVRRWPVRVATRLIRRPWSDPGRWVEERGGAALVSTPGDDVADAVIGTWSYPLGVSVGRPEPRPVVRDGSVVVRPAFTLTLNFDRRVMAGAQAAWFLRRVVERLEGD